MIWENRDQGVEFLSALLGTGGGRPSHFEGVMPGFVLDRHPLPSCEFFQSPLAVEAAYSRSFFTSESNQGVIIDRPVIDMDRTRVDLLCEFGPVLYIPGMDCTAQPKSAVIGNLYSFVGSVEGHDTDGWTKHLILRYRHLWAHVGEDCRRNEIPICLAAQDNSRSFIGAFLDLLGESDYLRLVDERTQIGFRVPGITYFKLGHPGNILFKELPIETSVHENPIR